MAGNRSQEILFVFHGKNQSKRSQELQDARRRAHAARQSARKNRDGSGSASPGRRASESRNVVEVTLPDAPAQRGPVRRFPTLPPFEKLLDVDESGQPVVTLVSPMSLLSQDLTDPFRSTVVGQLPSILQKYLHDAQTMIWPALVPLVPRDQATLFYQRSPVDAPLEIDHQIDAAAAIALQYLRPRNQAVVNQIIAIGKEHRQRSITWVNNQIAEARGPPDSKIIAALLSLISHSGLKQPGKQSRYPESPLVLGEFSALFSPSRVLPEDMRFLYQIVDLKGGEEWIGSDTVDQDLPLRLMLNHFDIFVASRKGTPPMWHSIAAVPATVMRSYSSARLSPGHRATGYCSGFNSIQDSGLHDAVEAVRSSINALEAYRHGGNGAPSFSLLVHMRMFAQHQLIMLYPEANEPSRLSGVDAVIHPAVMILSDLVLFALTPAAGVRPRCIQELHTALEALPVSDSTNALRLWGLMMLGIGSITCGNMHCYVIHQLQSQTVVEAKPDNWVALKQQMLAFLWWDYALDMPASDVWTAAARARSAT